MIALEVLNTLAIVSTTAVMILISLYVLLQFICNCYWGLLYFI